MRAQIAQPPGPDIAGRLQPGERLLWTGRPGAGIRLSRQDVKMIPLSLLFAGVALVWEYIAVRSGPLIMKIWGIPFVATGAYMPVGRFFYDAYRRARTWYAVTDRRVLIVTDVWGARELTLNTGAIPQIQLEEGPDGSGTIVFGERPPVFLPRNPKWEEPPRLDYIDNVRSVYNLICPTPKGGVHA